MNFESALPPALKVNLQLIIHESCIIIMNTGVNGDDNNYNNLTVQHDTYKPCTAQERI